MPDAKPLILVHAEWGERMRTASVIAAICAVVALAFYRFAKFRRVLALITTIIAAWACYCAFQAAKHGGAMVYHHGVGVQIHRVDRSTARSATARRRRRQAYANSGQDKLAQALGSVSCFCRSGSASSSPYLPRNVIILSL